MIIEVSIGEVVDKYNILELKLKKISNETKLIEIKKEIEALKECKKYIDKYQFFYNLLMYVNEEIWNMTDKIKTLKYNDNVEDESLNKNFAEISNKIFEFNQKRFRLKDMFNKLFNSELKEQKSYSLSKCKIIIENEEILYNKIPEINYLLIEYDLICFDTNLNTSMFKNTNIIKELETDNIINLKDFSIENRQIFEFIPVNYISGGLLGDFINQLSVINELFYITGRKGNLYISNNIADQFRFGVEIAFNDTKQIILLQKYINKYEIYNNQIININLSSWRNSNLLYKTTWNEIFKTTYNIDWGKRKWITLPKDKFWNNIVLISMSSYRFPTNTDFKKLIEKYGENILFVTQSKNDYQNFVNITGLKINCFYPNTLFDFYCCINSCKLFVSNLSSPLTISIACNIPFVICMENECLDNIHNMGYSLIRDNANYSLNNI